jgi:hypothetical protein
MGRDNHRGPRCCRVSVRTHVARRRQHAAHPFCFACCPAPSQSAVRPQQYFRQLLLTVAPVGATRAFLAVPTQLDGLNALLRIRGEPVQAGPDAERVTWFTGNSWVEPTYHTG